MIQSRWPTRAETESILINITSWRVEAIHLDCTDTSSSHTHTHTHIQTHALRVLIARKGACGAGRDSKAAAFASVKEEESGGARRVGLREPKKNKKTRKKKNLS